MKKVLTILFCLIELSSFSQDTIKVIGPDTTMGLNKVPSHLWSFFPFKVKAPLFNNNDTVAIDPTYYYKQSDADSSLASKATLLGTPGKLQLVSTLGVLSDSYLSGDFSGTSVRKSLVAGASTNVVLNSEFNSNARWYQQFGSWTFTGGVATANAAPYVGIWQPTNRHIDSGVRYLIEYDIIAYTSGGIYGAVLGASGRLNSGVGHYSDIVTTPSLPDSAQNYTLTPGASGFIGAIDNFTVKGVVDGDLISTNNVKAGKIISLGGGSGHLMADGTILPRLSVTHVGSGAASLDSVTQVLNIPTPTGGGGLADSVYYFKQGGNYTPGFLGSLDATALNFRTANTLRGSFDASGNFNIINGGNNNIRLLQSGQVALGTGSYSMYPVNTSTGALDATSGAFRFAPANSTGYEFLFQNALTLGITPSSGDHGVFTLHDGFAGTGNSSYHVIKIDGTFNTTTSGEVAGIWVAPSIVAAPTFVGVKIDNNAGIGIGQSGASAKNYLLGSTGIGTASPNASALLDISSTTKGFLPPRMNTTQQNAISSPATGLILFNNDSASLMQYTGSTWQSLRSVTGGGGGSGTVTSVATGLGLSGGTITNTGTLLVDTSSASILSRQRAAATYAPITPALTISSAGTLTLTHNADYVFSGTTATWTLPAIDPTKTGRAQMITIKNRGSGNITLNTASGSVLYATSLVSTFAILPGEAYTIMPDGTYFNVE